MSRPVGRLVTRRRRDQVLRKGGPSVDGSNPTDEPSGQPASDVLPPRAPEGGQARPVRSLRLPDARRTLRGWDRVVRGGGGCERALAGSAPPSGPAATPICERASSRGSESRSSQQPGLHASATGRPGRGSEPDPYVSQISGESVEALRGYARSSRSSMWQRRCRATWRPSWVRITAAVLSSSGLPQQSQTGSSVAMPLSSASTGSCSSAALRGLRRG
jgi:hypothetical protein